MAIFSRIIRLWKADLHGIMDELEDKSLLLRQSLRDMEDELARKQAVLERLREERERLVGRRERLQQDLQSLEQDLRVAFTKEKDSIARMLVRKIKTIQRQEQEAATRLNGLDQEIKTRQDKLASQQEHYERLKSKAADYFLNRERERSGFTEFEPAAADPGHRDTDFSEEEIELELIKYRQIFEKDENGATL